jgi:hypothetical protein
MPNRSLDDNREALDDLDLGATGTRLSDFESHHVTDYTSLASDNKQIFVMGALDHDIAQHPQDPFGGWGDIEPLIASATGHLGLKSANILPQRKQGAQSIESKQVVALAANSEQTGACSGVWVLSIV